METVIDSVQPEAAMWTELDEAERRLEQHLHRLKDEGWSVEDCGTAYQLTKAGEVPRQLNIVTFYAISERVVR